MSMRFHATCPICNALIGYELSGDVVCPHCKTELLVGSSDPTCHDLTEIDPDIGGGSMGVFHVNLHPAGTLVCVACQQIYPDSFECCPKLVDLALMSYGQKTKFHGPKTDERIAKFLRDNERVVTNTVRLRALEAEHGQLDKKTTRLMKSTLKHLGLLNLMETET